MDKRVYLAAPWIDREKMPEIAQKFEQIGCTITHKWWEYEGEGQEHESPEFLQECGLKDVQGVWCADVVVVINSSKSEGKAVEQGIAIGRSIPIIIVGKRGEHSKNVFHYVEDLYAWVESIDEALTVVYEGFGNE